MSRYYKVAMGFLTLGFEMNLLLLTSSILPFGLTPGVHPDIEAVFICAFIAYSTAFLLAGFLNFGYLKDNHLLPFATSGPAILAAVLTSVGISLLSSRIAAGVRDYNFILTVYGVSVVMAILSAALMIYARLRHG